MSARFLCRVGICALLALPMLVGDSFGQQRGRRGGPGGPRGGPGFGGPGMGAPGGILSLAVRSEVQEALGLNSDQKDYVRLIQDGMRDSMREAMQSVGRDGNPRERFQQIREIMAKQNEEAEGQLVEAIGKDKVARLKQIDVQINGVRLLMTDQDSEVAKKLELSEDQQQQLRDATAEVEEELQEVRRSKVTERLEGILSSSQKAKWREMTGDPIDFTLERRRPGVGGRRGEGRPRGDGERRRQGGRRRPQSDST